MQTRKRAKSITFGKPKKEEEVKTKAAEEEKVAAPAEVKSEEPKKVEKPKETKTSEESPEPTEAAKKVLAIEESEKDLSPTLSSTPEPVLSDKPATESSVEASASEDKPEDKPEEKETPADNFVIDATPGVDIPVEEKAEEPVSDLSAAPDASLSPVNEAESKPATATQDLSETPPSSAFSLQDDVDGGEETGGGKKKHFLVYFLVIALFSFILGIGAMAVLSMGLIPGVSLPKEIPFATQLGQVLPQQAAPTVAPTVSQPAPTTAPTSKPVDLKAYSISVLNGSGVKGKAAEVKTSLTTAGYKVTTSGNAASNDFTSTEISAKKDVDQAYIDKLKADLGKDFTVKVDSAPAPASQTTDVVVTIGSSTAK